MKNVILLICTISFFLLNVQSQTKKVIIDADTANELDDVIAISRALMSDKLEVIGLTASQWNYQKSYSINTVEESWKLNNTILKLMNIESIPSLMGSELLVGERWEGLKAYYGGIEPQKSDASDFIIQKARELPDDEKLIILTLGPLTNIASAILTDPRIAKKISLYFLGANYDLEKGVWNKNEFNVRNDLNAFDVILNTKELDLFIMPANVSFSLSFKNKSSLDQLEGKDGIAGLICERWKEFVSNPNDEWGWVMWDLALIHAFIHPEWVEKKTVITPPENLQREITVYTHIDHEKMKEDFWKHF